MSPWSSGVRTGPGAIALMRTPARPQSPARRRTRAAERVLRAEVGEDRVADLVGEPARLGLVVREQRLHVGALVDGRQLRGVRGHGERRGRGALAQRLEEPVEHVDRAEVVHRRDQRGRPHVRADARRDHQPIESPVAAREHAGHRRRRGRPACPDRPRSRHRAGRCRSRARRPSRAAAGSPRRCPTRCP